MFRFALLACLLASASAFAPSAVLPRTGARAVTMQLYQEGKAQGKGVNAIPIFKRPESLKGDMVGDLGFDPLGVTTWANKKFIQEAEIKHGRIAMLAFAGITVETIGIKLPMYSGISGDIFEIHNAAVKSGAMGQILLWTSFFEICAGVPAMNAMLEGTSDRAPGFYGFDPLGLGKSNMAKNQLAEIQNGRAAMLAVSGMVHHALINGKVQGLP